MKKSFNYTFIGQKGTRTTKENKLPLIINVLLTKKEAKDSQARNNGSYKK